MNSINNELLATASFKPYPFKTNSAWRGHLPFAAWLTRTFKPTTIVELGSHWGHSYFSFCQAVSEGQLSTTCYAVDTWQGDDHAGNYGDEVYAHVNAHNQANYASFSHLLRMTFDDALKQIPDGTVELLHIDGLHTYEAVKHDFDTWKCKLAPGAIVLFHDTNVREREFGVWKLWEELQAIYPNNLEFTHSYGLGVLQIEGAITDKKMVWLEPQNADKQFLKDYFAALGTRLIEQFELGVMTLHANNLSVELGWRDEWLSDHKHQLARRTNELADQVQQYTQLTKDLAQTKQVLNQQRDEFHNILKSTSWRITKPMRIVSRLTRLIFTGNFGEIWYLIKLQKKNTLISKLIPTSIIGNLKETKNKFKQYTSETDSSMNLAALQDIVEKRATAASNLFAPSIIEKPLTASNYPAIDISLVTYNSGKWLQRYFASVEKLDYPLSLLTVFALDNGSTDDTLVQLHDAKKALKKLGIELHVAQGPNVGFGAGHNTNIRLGRSPLLLVSNVDLFFETDALKQVVQQAMLDDHLTAAWEFRQKPYEHPKYYDPVSGLTNWNSHACVLMRRDAFEATGGYDENIFMYGEDVDLSYNFRSKGYVIKYLPKAVVWHDTYEEAEQIKPLQYAGSTFASSYLRFKYGTVKDIVAIPKLQRLLLNSPPVYEGAHVDVKSNGRKLVTKALGALVKRKRTNANFPFRAFDYDLTRAGAFHKLQPISSDGPLVTIITRTFRGRATYLQQAIISVLNQTYTNIEHIVVEDGGNTHQGLCQIASLKNKNLRYISLSKVGRSKTGNEGLTLAKGKYCMFLDDDDLLFADHVEVLVDALQKDATAAAAYSPAMEIATDVTNKETGSYIETQYSFPAGLFQPFSFAKIQEHNYIAIQSILFEHKLFEQRGGFDETLEYLEDWNLWVRYAWSNKFIYVPKVTSMYRVPASKLEYQHRFSLLDGALEGVYQKNAEVLAEYERST